MIGQVKHVKIHHIALMVAVDVLMEVLSMNACKLMLLLSSATDQQSTDSF